MSSIGRKILFGDDKIKKFTNSDLPKNRKQQFLYLVKTRLSKLFYVNLLVCLFAFPLLIWHLMCLSHSFSFGEINAENFNAYLQFVTYYKSSLRLVLAIPASYGIAGGLYVIRRMAWGEPISLLKTFFKGIKLNLLQFSIFGIIYGIFAGIYDSASAILAFIYPSDGIEAVVFRGGMILSVFLFIGVAQFLVTLCSTYSVKTLSAIKNSFILVGKTLPKTMGILCLSVFPFGIMLSIGNVFIDIICIVILLIFGFSYMLTVISLYTNSIYDEFINANDYPDYYRRGLAPRELKCSEETNG